MKEDFQFSVSARRIEFPLTVNAVLGIGFKVMLLRCFNVDFVLVVELEGIADFFAKRLDRQERQTVDVGDLVRKLLGSAVKRVGVAADGVNDGMVGEVKRQLRFVLIPLKVGVELEVDAGFRIEREKNVAVFRFLRCKIRFGGNAVDVELVGEVTALSA